MRGFFFESARENAKVPVKIFKKVCVKNFFTRDETKKRQKNGVTHSFYFHAEKKTLEYGHNAEYVEEKTLFNITQK